MRKASGMYCQGPTTPVEKELVWASTNHRGFNTMLPTYQWSKENLHAYEKIRRLPLWDSGDYMMMNSFILDSVWYTVFV